MLPAPQRANAGPDQSSLDFQIILGRDSNDSISARTDDQPDAVRPRFRRGLLVPVRRGAGQIPAGHPRPDHRSGQRGRDHLYAHPSPPSLSRVSIDPTVVLWLIRATGAVRPSRLGEWLR